MIETLPPPAEIRPAERVLIVDDEPTVRAVLRRWLESAGYECAEAPSAEAAWQSLLDDSYDLMITDIVMPDSSGLDLLTRARQRFPEMAVVMATGLSERDTASLALQMGAYGYLLKPFDQNEVLIDTAAALQRRRRDREERQYERKLEREVTDRTQRLLAANRALEKEVAERRQAEQALVESREKLRAIVENIGVGVALISPEMRVLEMNRQMRTWFPAVKPEEKPTCYCVFHDPPAQAPCSWCPVVRTLRDGRVHEDESRTRMGGRTVNFRLVSSPFHGPAGDIVGAIEMIEDVTARRDMEARLNRARRLEAIGRLAAGIAHEINTPVQYTGDNVRFLEDACARLLRLCRRGLGLAAAVQRGDAPLARLAEMAAAAREEDFDYLAGEIPRAVQQSLDGIGRVTAIIRAMRDFSHPGADKRSLTDLNRLIESALTVSRNEWKHAAEVRTCLDPALPLVQGYPAELSQALLNVIVNAAQAVRETAGEGAKEKGRISVSTSHAGGWVEIRISDTGPGIPEENRDRVFDPFFTTKPVGQGTGQGLAIVHAVIVQKHGGSVAVESAPEGGAAFVLRLPVGAAETRTEGAA